MTVCVQRYGTLWLAQLVGFEIDCLNFYEELNPVEFCHISHPDKQNF
jgi:hypothetical protein